MELRLKLNLVNAAGDPFLVLKRGGHERGGTELTAYARSFIREYRKLEENVRQKADREFERFRKRV